MAIAAFEARLTERLSTLQTELVNGVYQPLPVRRVLIPKRGEGLRPLAIWTLRDRVAQRAVFNWLEPFFEPLFLECSYGYRPGRSVEMAVQAVLKARDEGLRWVVDADIKECFDSIDGDLAARLVRQRVQDATILRLVDVWLGVEVLEANGRTRRAGAAQGGILSPLLCNIYLHAFDEALTKRGWRLVRYADDFVVLFRRRQEAEAALEEARTLLAQVKLELKPEKTHVKHFDEGFKFLGVFFVGQRHYPL